MHHLFASPLIVVCNYLIERAAFACRMFGLRMLPPQFSTRANVAYIDACRAHCVSRFGLRMLHVVWLDYGCSHTRVGLKSLLCTCCVLLLQICLEQRVPALALRGRVDGRRAMFGPPGQIFFGECLVLRAMRTSCKSMSYIHCLDEIVECLDYGCCVSRKDGNSSSEEDQMPASASPEQSAKPRAGPKAKTKATAL